MLNVTTHESKPRANSIDASTRTAVEFAPLLEQV